MILYELQCISQGGVEGLKILHITRMILLQFTYTDNHRFKKDFTNYSTLLDTTYRLCSTLYCVSSKGVVTSWVTSILKID